MEEGRQLVDRVELCIIGLTGVFSSLGALFAGWPGALGVAAGGLVGLVNFKGLYFFTRLIFALDRRWTRLFTHMSVLLRYLALTALVLIIIRSGWVNPVALLVGLSLVTVSVILVGLIHGLRLSDPARQAG
jgi:hypothetical protein